MTQVLKTFLKSIEQVGSLDIYTHDPEKSGQVSAMKELAGLAGAAAKGQKLTKKELRRVLKGAGLSIEKSSDEN